MFVSFVCDTSNITRVRVYRLSELDGQLLPPLARNRDDLPNVGLSWTYLVWIQYSYWATKLKICSIQSNTETVETGTDSTVRRASYSGEVNPWSIPGLVIPKTFKVEVQRFVGPTSIMARVVLSMRLLKVQAHLIRTSSLFTSTTQVTLR